MEPAVVNNILPEVNCKIYGSSHYRFVLLLPPTNVQEVKKIVENTGFKLIPLQSGNKNHFFYIFADKVTNSNHDEIRIKLDEVTEKIQELQFTSFEKNKEKINLDKSLVNVLADFITTSNNKIGISEQEAFLILQNLLKDLARRSDEEIILFDDKEIEFLAKASISKVLEQAQDNLNNALVLMIVKIYKLFLTYLADALAIEFINLRTDLQEIPIFQKNKQIIFSGMQHEVIPLPVLTKTQFLLFNPLTKSIITTDMGKKVAPKTLSFIQTFFMDQIIITIIVEFSSILAENMRRAMKEILRQITIMDIDFSKTTEEEINNKKEEIKNMLNFTFRNISNLRNSINSQKKEHNFFYKHEYNRILSSQLGGGIPERIRNMSPIRTIEEYDKILLELDDLLDAINKLEVKTNYIFNSLIAKKKENDLAGLKFIWNELKDFASDILAKITRGGI